MENAIIIRTDKQFEEKALNDAVKGLAKAFTNIDKNRRDACLIMWRLEDGKKFEKDGFKSLQEFAETIGIDKSSAHRMADAGRVYDSKIPEIAEFAEKAGYTAASKVASMVKNEKQEKALADAIKNGDVNPNMTVEKIGAWKAEAINSTESEKVLPKYKIEGEVNKNPFDYESIELEMIPELDGFVKVGAFDFITGKDTTEKRTIYASPITGSLAWIKAEKVKKEKKASVKSVKGNNFSIEELEQMLARAREAANK